MNTYIVYYLGAWPVNPIKNSNFKNCLFGATSIKNSDKEKWVYIGYEK